MEAIGIIGPLKGFILGLLEFYGGLIKVGGSIEGGTN